MLVFFGKDAALGMGDGRECECCEAILALLTTRCLQFSVGHTNF